MVATLDMANDLMDRSVLSGVHTGLTFLGWAVLFPTAVYIAVFEQNRLPNYHVISQGLQYSAVAAISISYTIFMTVGWYTASEPYDIFTHVLMAWLLLHTVAVTIWDTVKRSWWSVLLRGSSFLLMFSGLALVGLGIYNQPWAEQNVGIAYGMYVLTVAVVFLWAKMHVDLERQGHLQTLVIGPPPPVIVVQQKGPFRK